MNPRTLMSACIIQQENCGVLVDYVDVDRAAAFIQTLSYKTFYGCSVARFAAYIKVNLSGIGKTQRCFLIEKLSAKIIQQ